jgi:hypothetical protein
MIQEMANSDAKSRLSAQDDTFRLLCYAAKSAQAAKISAIMLH